jgi:CRP/FNR family transcriptional regulator, nitrogen fixation regulation protein
MHIQPTFRANAAFPHGALAGSDLLSAMQPAAVTLFPADGLIYAQGDATGRELYLVEFGTVRICRLTADGRRQITGFLTAGDVFGFEAGDEHDSCAESVDGAGVRILRPMAGQAPTNAILQMALKSLARTQHQLMLLGCRSANARMAAFLADLSERQAAERIVHLAMQRNDVADYLGLTIETVSRTLRFLKDEGIIRLKSIADIEILDRTALDDLCE